MEVHKPWNKAERRWSVFHSQTCSNSGHHIILLTVQQRLLQCLALRINSHQLQPCTLHIHYFYTC